MLPAGTIPDSPAPFQRALEMDRLGLNSSPVRSPTAERNATIEAVPTPMPGTNLPLEDISSDKSLPPYATNGSQDLPGYFDIPLDDDKRGRADYNHTRSEHDAARETGATAFQDFRATFRGNATVHTVDDTQKPVPRRGSREEGQLLVPWKQRSSYDGPPMDDVKHLICQGGARSVAGDRLVSDMAVAIFTPSIPTSDKAELEQRQKFWGHHTELYDGTGYGKDSSSITSRPSTSTEKSSDAADVTLSKPQAVPADRFSVKGPAERKPATSAPEAAFTTTGDHENSDVVTRSYVTPKDKGTSDVSYKGPVYDSDKDKDEVVVVAMTDADISDRMTAAMPDE
ncbi:hypothetical protein N0V83_000466 [Neocucurbitaria cava]|uniref:Uncharacterized protein n=1 Tax=Neocucurbitaria cava TaxID=798079 RepID=A0A9W8YIR7_9PLEO|nr:hypothetical protein N0V83_000466 [Neocucurbitaria cava]